MKPFFSKALALALLMGLVLSSTAFAASNHLSFDFEQNDAGFIPIFADYPVDAGADAFYELAHSLDIIPIKDAGKGLFISGNNHSDDLFMGYYKELTGFTPNVPCTFKVWFKLATNVDGGMIGVGGSPGSSVYVKCGITQEKPIAVAAELDYYRLNIDKGNQGMAGNDMAIIGNIEKYDTLLPGEYEYKEFEFSVETTPDEDGKVYLIIGTDSGFEATTSYYLDDIEIQWTEKSGENKSFSIVVDEKNIDMSDLSYSPYYEGDSLMVPLRKIGEALGYTVDWNGETGAITMEDAYVQKATLFDGMERVVFEGKLQVIDMNREINNSVKTIIHQGHTYVPLEFFEEFLNTTSIDGTIVTVEPMRSELNDR